MIRIFIGYDEREATAFHVLCHSILRRASQPVSITPLVKRTLPYTRERGPTESTDFSLTRFLVPWLCNYEGRALFMDCDMLCLVDVAILFRDSLWEQKLTNSSNDVWVCKHQYVPKTERKMDGIAQTSYEKKNWSSLMLFYNKRCRRLTPDYVNTTTDLSLHQFAWADEIGSLPIEWNWLVGEYESNPEAKILHYTLGGPWFGRTEEQEPWSAELRHMLASMG